jgi:hypothetical protein
MNIHVALQKIKDDLNEFKRRPMDPDDQEIMNDLSTSVDTLLELYPSTTKSLEELMLNPFEDVLDQIEYDTGKDSISGGR